MVRDVRCEVGWYVGFMDYDVVRIVVQFGALKLLCVLVVGVHVFVVREFAYCFL